MKRLILLFGIVFTFFVLQAVFDVNGVATTVMAEEGCPPDQTDPHNECVDYHCTPVSGCGTDNCPDNCCGECEVPTVIQQYYEYGVWECFECNHARRTVTLVTIMMMMDHCQVGCGSPWYEYQDMGYQEDWTFICWYLC
jgi:hypothetical protein